MSLYENLISIKFDDIDPLLEQSDNFSLLAFDCCLFDNKNLYFVVYLNESKSTEIKEVVRGVVTAKAVYFIRNTPNSDTVLNTTKLSNVVEYIIGSSKNSFEILTPNPEANTLALKFFKVFYNDIPENIYDIYSLITYHQSMLLKVKYKRLVTRKQNFIKQLLTNLPNESTDFDKWLKFNAMPQSNYFFYSFSRKKYNTGICSVCGEQITLLSAINNSSGICPKCASNIYYRSNNRRTTASTVENIISVSYDNDVIVFRLYSIQKTFKEYKQKIKKTIISMIVLKDGNSYYLTKLYNNFKLSSNWRLIDKSNFYNFKLLFLSVKNENIFSPLLVFDKIKSFNILNDTYFSNLSCSHKLFIASMLYRDFSIESLFKIGNLSLFNNTMDNYISNYSCYKSIKPKKLYIHLNIPKRYHTLIPKMDKQIYLVLSDKLIKNISLSVKDIQKLLNYNVSAKMLYVVDLLSFDFFLEYIKNQSKYPLDESEFDYNILLYRDYINTVELSQIVPPYRKNTILTPRNLQIAHDYAVHYNHNDFNKESLKLALKEYSSRYSYSNNEYAIIPPKDDIDIRKEGKLLSHCVATYIDLISKGQSIIMFLRKKENINKPLYTLECSNKGIIQCRGYKNCKPTEDINKFLEEYTNYLQN